MIDLTTLKNYYEIYTTTKQQHRHSVYNSWDVVQIVNASIRRWFLCFNSLRPRRNRRHFADDIFKCIFLNANEWISLRISLKFVPKVRIYNIPSLVQIMAWRRPGDKPLSEPRVVSLLTHICVTRPQWVNPVSCSYTCVRKYMEQSCNRDRFSLYFKVKGNCFGSSYFVV